MRNTNAPCVPSSTTDEQTTTIKRIDALNEEKERTVEGNGNHAWKEQSEDPVLILYYEELIYK